MRHGSPLRPGDSGLAARLRSAIEGDVLFDAASRGRYGTDPSIYQIEPEVPLRITETNIRHQRTDEVKVTRQFARFHLAA